MEKRCFYDNDVWAECWQQGCDIFREKLTKRLLENSLHIDMRHFRFSHTSQI